ncbi:MAG: non-ribosomal peptide synthetase, partial [Flavitalea sp.]
TDYPRPAVQSKRGAEAGFIIDKELGRQLEQIGQQQGATLFMTLLAAFNVLLHRYSGQQDICVGTAVAGRDHQELEGLIGFFINTLALRSAVKCNDSFSDLLVQLRKTTLEAYEHQQVPFEKVVDAVVKQRDMSRTPIFQVMFVWQNTPEVPELRLGEARLKAQEFAQESSKFDLIFTISESPNALYGSVNYCTDLYSEATIRRMMAHFKELLSSIVKEPQQRIGMLPMLSKAEENELLINFNNNQTEYQKNKNIIDLFEEQAAKTPHKTAVVFGKQQVSYEQLNQRSNQLARYLVRKGVKHETLVPICVERSVEMIVGILAILKAGGAYVPIDTNYPSERISYLLQDSGGAIVLSNSHSKSKLISAQTPEIIELDGNWSDIKKQSKANLNMAIKPDQLAYVIYTSGSTGKPKGVMVEHKNVVSLVKGVDYVSLGARDVLLSTGSFSFDATTVEYWGMLLNGGQLVLCSETRLLNTELLKEEIRTRKVTKMWFTSSWFNQLIETDISVFEGLQTIIAGGEKLSEQHINQIRQTYPSINLINGYGPTENTTFSLTYNITDKTINAVIPIGRPLNNRQAYVLDHFHQPVPIGVAGEIFLGGDGLSRGYLNRNELTAEKFIVDPFSKEKGARLYKTGDLGRWLPDGNIQYLGRLDDQVKIRGFRIELGEIENVLQQSDLVRHAVVIAKEDAEHNKRLVGYVVPQGDFDRGTILTYLKNKLPEYMVPTLWIELQHLPLTPNGKVDKKALPDPDVSELFAKQFVAPRNELEASLVEIWKKLIGVEQVGIQDNFFEIGGHSLLAMRLVSIIRRELAVEVPLFDIFDSTIESLAGKIKAEQEKTNSANIKSGKPVTIIHQKSPGLEAVATEWDLNGKSKYIIPLKEDGTKIPFFCILSIHPYRLLSKYMPDDQPLYYLPPTQAVSVGEIASHYVKEIKLIQPSGPYCIGGFCGGAKIALEIAQQLKAHDDEVAALVLFEFYSSRAMLSTKSLRYKTRKFAYYKRRFMSLKKSKRPLLDSLGFIIKKSFDRFKKPFVKSPPPKFITSPEFRNYVCMPYPGKVILFRASIPPLEMKANIALMGWEGYFNNVQVITAEGGHLGIFREPAVRKLAGQLKTVLDQVNKKEELKHKEISLVYQSESH